MHGGDANCHGNGTTIRRSASRGRDLLYMMYTSGSTGLPKGALIRHDGALNHMLCGIQPASLPS